MFNKNDSMTCTRCGLIMANGEPYSNQGEFYHKSRDKPCPNDGKTFYYTTKRGQGGTRTVEPFTTKKTRRARTRGAKKARKLR